jgi:hypothetical protein
MTQFTCKGVKQIKNRISLNITQSRSKYYLRTKFQDGIDKPQKCRNVCYHPTHEQQSDFLILVLYVLWLYCYATTRDLQIVGWRFGLVTGDFLSTYLMHVFIVYWCFPFVCFSIAFCLHCYCFDITLWLWMIMNKL